MLLTVGFHVENSDVCFIYFWVMASKFLGFTYFSDRLQVVIRRIPCLFECCDLIDYQPLPLVSHRTHQMIRELRSGESVVFIDWRWTVYFCSFGSSTGLYRWFDSLACSWCSLQRQHPDYWSHKTLNSYWPPFRFLDFQSRASYLDLQWSLCC